MKRAVSLLLCSSILASGAASADILSEARFGVMQENICILDCDNANKEPGQNISAELLFASPDFLDLIWSPKPYVMGSVNFQGETSFGGDIVPRAASGWPPDSGTTRQMSGGLFRKIMCVPGTPLRPYHQRVWHSDAAVQDVRRLGGKRHQVFSVRAGVSLPRKLLL